MAKELGLAYNTLRRWVKEYKESNGTSFVGSGNIKPQNQEIIELRRRNHLDLYNIFNHCGFITTIKLGAIHTVNPYFFR
ncbi:transposase [Anoxybacteroides rupiense]|uniref:transposase n=1 Tax=Anoxybacteroides rupiense TaxID=311460 RepID=UPI00366E70B7